MQLVRTVEVRDGLYPCRRHQEKKCMHLLRIYNATCQYITYVVVVKHIYMYIVGNVHIYVYIYMCCSKTKRSKEGNYPSSQPFDNI